LDGTFSRSGVPILRAGGTTRLFARQPPSLHGREHGTESTAEDRHMTEPHRISDIASQTTRGAAESTTGPSKIAGLRLIELPLQRLKRFLL
jgi:hypothetical protein